ncbi:hypothetical protein Sste5344_007144 [Sporothrix stenoceras]
MWDTEIQQLKVENEKKTDALKNKTDALQNKTEENQRIQSELDKAIRNRGALQGQLDEANRKLEDSDASRATLQEALDSAEQALVAEEQRHKKTQQLVRTEQMRAAGLEGELGTAQRKLTDAKRVQDQTQEALNQTQKTLNTKDESLRTALDRVAALHHQLNDAQATQRELDLATAEANIQVQQQLTEAKDTLAQTLESLGNAQTGTAAAEELLAITLEKMEQELKAAEARENRLIHQLTRLKGKLAKLRARQPSQRRHRRGQEPDRPELVSVRDPQERIGLARM